jgi:hypothetical protein
MTVELTLSVELWKDELLMMVVVDDKASDRIFGQHVDAYIRGFILRDRNTGEVHGLMRFKYPDGHRSWTEIRLNEHRENPAEYIREGFEKTFGLTTSFIGMRNAVRVFRAPCSGMTPEETLEWLLKEDLVELKVDMKVGAA